MSIPTDINVQTDFSGGQINTSAQRREDVDAVKTGCLQAINFRPQAQGTLLSRPGRRALYPGGPRVECVRMSGAWEYHIGFVAGQLFVTDLLGNEVFVLLTPGTWHIATMDQISFVQANYQVIICFPGMRPIILNWDPNTFVWTSTPWVFNVIGNNSQEPFWRVSALGAYMTWTATPGTYDTPGSSIVLTCSQPYFRQKMVGNLLSIIGAQLLITSIISTTQANVTVMTRLPDTVAFAGVSDSAFLPGQVAESTNSGIQFEVGTVAGGNVVGVVMNSTVLVLVNNTVADTVSSQSASSATSGFALYTGSTSTVQWQEEFMSALSGWPASVCYGNNRLIFTQFPQRPEAILWSEIDETQGFYIDSGAAITNSAAGASANSAILEFCTPNGEGRPTVYYVVDTGDEFVFTDRGVFYIPISATASPLKPGSVQFILITNDGCLPVRPIPMMKQIIYAPASGTRISAVFATGSLTLPYATTDMTDVHFDLFNFPVCIAVSSGSDSPDRLVYVVNSDNTLIVGKFSAKSGFVGWHPESGAGLVQWAAAAPGALYYSTSYGGKFIIEIEDPTQYLDSVINYNNPPTSLALGSPYGTFWWLAGGLVTLARTTTGDDLGDRTLDSAGNLVPLPGEVLRMPDLIGGTPIAKTFQPIVRNAPGGESRRQRMRRRTIRNAMLTLETNAECQWGSKTITAWQFGDSVGYAPGPPAVKQSVRTRPIGRAYDPCVVFTSARYGVVQIWECSLEVTI